jgi:hypothetical protein
MAVELPGNLDNICPDLWFFDCLFQEEKMVLGG